MIPQAHGAVSAYAIVIFAEFGGESWNERLLLLATRL